MSRQNLPDKTYNLQNLDKTWSVCPDKNQSRQKPRQKPKCVSQQNAGVSVLTKKPGIGYRSFDEAELMISQYITGYYSQYRPHQHNGGLPPNHAEENYWLTSKNMGKNT